MCGLIAIASNAGVTGWQLRQQFMAQALQVGTVRGDHATGLLLCPNDDPKIGFGDVVQFKRPVDGYTFTQLNAVSRLLGNIDHYKYIIGHNRLATSGLHNYSGAHPFVSGNIGLSHNGTLYSAHGDIANEFKDFAVDSAWLTWAIDKYGHEEVLTQISGALAIIWHDQGDDKLRFLRNDDRPLCYARTKDKETLFITSESQMLIWLAWRNSIEIETVKIATPGIIYEVDSSIKITQKKIEFFKHTVVPFKGNDIKTYHQRKQDYTRESSYSKPRLLSGPKVDELLGELGLKVGGTVEWSYSATFAPTTSARHGRATGCMIKQPHYEVAQYNARLDAYEDKYILKGTVIGMEYHFMNYHTVVVADVEATKKHDPYWSVQNAASTKSRKSKKEVRLALPSAKGDKIVTNARNTTVREPVLKILEPDGNLRAVTSLGKASDSPKQRLREGLTVMDANEYLNSWSHAGDMYPADSVDTLPGPEGIEIPLSEFYALTKYGCSCCSTVIVDDEAADIEWTYDRRPICKRCDYEQNFPDV